MSRPIHGSRVTATRSRSSVASRSWRTAGSRRLSIFHDGHDPPHFAAYDLLTQTEVRTPSAATSSPTSASRSTAASGSCSRRRPGERAPDCRSLGHSPEELAELNRRAVALLESLRDELETGLTPIVVSGCVGPRGDGYPVGEAMSADEAA